MRNSSTRDVRLYIPSDLYYGSGFRATLDGRGFAISNINPSQSSSGIFGMFNGATIKNIAFTNIKSGHADGSVGMLAYNTYRTTFENVYFSVTASAAGDSYMSTPAGPRIVGAIDDRLGVSTFTNVMFENTVELVAGNTAKHNRVIFSNQTTGSYTNTNVIGLPVTYKYAAHATDTANYVLTLNLPSSAMTKLGVTAKEYALAECPLADEYAGLISSLETKFSIKIEYITIAEDTAAGRGYYLDNAGLVADTTVANAYALMKTNSR